jgi:transglutaminase-like putative cysteine protease
VADLFDDYRLGAAWNEMIAADGTARVLPGGVRLDPAQRRDCAWTRRAGKYRYVDYWGTHVRVFEAHNPHRTLAVEVSSQVEVDAMRRPQPAELRSAGLHSVAVTDRFAEFLAATRMTEPPAELAALAETEAGRHPPAAAADAITAAVHDRMTYRAGSTGVHTLAGEAWEAGLGVCQDYAHLVVGALRHVGIPARYVSGYLHPRSAAAVGEPVAAESHAWVQWWFGEWTDQDPMNLAPVTDRHVTLGTGRDYRDVPPIKGIVAGTPVTTDLQVRVLITRVR